jgi:hypothetical protein
MTEGNVPSMIREVLTQDSGELRRRGRPSLGLVLMGLALVRGHGHLRKKAPTVGKSGIFFYCVRYEIIEKKMQSC